jgi:hypothetical protein
MEHTPEVFGRVVMLYVPMQVNGRPLQAFVDSGAQTSIMSVACAEQCGIMRLIDRRYAGIAKGVGQARILGRVHQAPCVIGGKHIAMSFTILEQPDMQFLFGLDQLKHHQACIDLEKNVLRIQGEEIPFLAEKDLPKQSEELTEDEKRLMQGGGAAIAAPSSSSSSSSAAASSSSSSSTSSSNRLLPSGSNVSQPTGTVPSSLGSIASAAHRPAGSLAASVPPPSSSPSQTAAPNAAAVEAAQRRAAAAAQPTPTPAAATPAAAAPAADPSAALQSAVTAAAQQGVQQLVDLGFSESESMQALLRFGGNVDAAASYLFSM